MYGPSVPHPLHPVVKTACSCVSPSLSSVVEALVDQHGRRYYMDHNTRTIAYEEEQRQTLGGEPDMQARREMLNRR